MFGTVLPSKYAFQLESQFWQPKKIVTEKAKPTKAYAAENNKNALTTFYSQKADIAESSQEK